MFDGPDVLTGLEGVLHASARDLTGEQRGVMTGELAEAWWMVTVVR